MTQDEILAQAKRGERGDLIVFSFKAYMPEYKFIGIFGEYNRSNKQLLWAPWPTKTDGGTINYSPEKTGQRDTLNCFTHFQIYKAINLPFISLDSTSSESVDDDILI